MSYLPTCYENGILQLSRALPSNPEQLQLRTAVREYLDSLA